jgi:prepilin-type N-terminal cleavage/methylation domain-containing protein
MDRLPRRLRVRLRARLHSDERGFTMLEVIIALSLVTAALVTLAYSATNGFRFIAFARERQAADQIGNSVMEDVRGLAYSKIKQGLKTETLGTDPYIQSCSGIYRLRLPGTASCAGEKIVSTSALANVSPLVPNSGTVGTAEGFPVNYSYRVYITNNCTAVAGSCTTLTPYRATVYVSWDSPQISGVAEYVQVQSYFWSPTGCVSSNTHPFAAPCQPFYYGQALMPAGSISITGGGITPLSLASASLLLPEAESTIQQEQVSQVQGKIAASATTLVDAGACADPNCNGGSTSSRTTAADADPSGATPTYAAITGGTFLGPSSTYTTTGGLASFTVANTAGDTGESEAAVTANATYPCPPTPVPQASAETDSLPCGGSWIHQAGTLSMTATLNGYAANLGTTTIASMASPGASSVKSYTFSNRQGVAGQSGNLEDTVDRQIGTVVLGGLPSAVPAPAGWSNGFVVLTGYHDRVFASSGTSASTTTAAISAGTLKYWNGTGYTTITLTGGGASGYGYSVPGYDQTVTSTVSGHTVDVRFRLSTGSPFAMGSQPTTATTSCGAGPCVSSATATVGSPIAATFIYSVTIDGSTVVNDLTFVVDLGTITAKSTYQAAPTAG